MKRILTTALLIVLFTACKKDSPTYNNGYLYEDENTIIYSCTATKQMGWLYTSYYWGYYVTVTGSMKNDIMGTQVNICYRDQGTRSPYGKGNWSCKWNTTDTASRSALHVYYQSASSSNRIEIPVTFQ